MQAKYRMNSMYLEFIGVFDNWYRMKHTTRVLEKSWIPIISLNFFCMIEVYLYAKQKNFLS